MVYHGAEAGNAQPAPSSPLDRLSNAVDNLRDVSKFIEAVADRLTGNKPPQAGTTTDAASKMAVIGGGGLIDSMERQTNTINGMVTAMRRNLGRIEARL